MTITTAELNDKAISDLLIHSHQQFLTREDKLDQEHLYHYSEFIPEGHSEFPGLYRHDAEKNDFMFRIGIDWDEIEDTGMTYEDWKDMTLELIAEATGSTLASIEEVREGALWTLFNLY
jgi:hypothetical protein|tara:strand:+ start:158 stop:514 length:357 start_codon:yes stop_codon:yes gene_type:complete